MSATGMAVPLAQAKGIASDVLDDLGPYCHRIAIAGSVRRGKPEVADLEIVAIPRWENSGGIFGTEPVNLLYEHLHQLGMFDWIAGDNPAGRYYKLRLPHDMAGMQLDLFTAGADNWGWIYLIRTGSSDFSSSMAARWKACQRLGKDQKGSVDGRLVTASGQVVPTPEEMDVFKLCHIEWIEPADRTDRLVLR